MHYLPAGLNDFLLTLALVLIVAFVFHLLQKWEQSKPKPEDKDYSQLRKELRDKHKYNKRIKI